MLLARRSIGWRLNVGLRQVTRCCMVRQQHRGVIKTGLGLLRSGDCRAAHREHLSETRVLKLTSQGSRYIASLNGANRLERHLRAIFPD